MEKVVSVESVEDPLLKELLRAFKEDSQRAARDLLWGIWVQAAISLVALLLAVGSTVRVLALLLDFGGRRPPTFFIAFDLTLTIVLFVLSIYSLARYLILRERYSRLSSLAEKLGR